MSFSRRTLAAFARFLDFAASHSEIEAIFFEFGVDKLDPHGNKLSRSIGLVRAFEQTLEPAKVPPILLEIAERHLPRPSFGGTAQPPVASLLAALELEGFELAGEAFRRTTPAPAALAPAISALESSLTKLGLSTAGRHYSQAVDNFTDGNWEACNSQVRPFVEDFIIGLGSRLTQTERKDPNAALQDLKSRGIIDDAEFHQFKSFWSGIQDNGPHRGTSSEEEALFRLHTSTAMARYLIQREP